MSQTRRQQIKTDSHNRESETETMLPACHSSADVQRLTHRPTKTWPQKAFRFPTHSHRQATLCAGGT